MRKSLTPLLLTTPPLMMDPTDDGTTTATSTNPIEDNTTTNRKSKVLWLPYMNGLVRGLRDCADDLKQK